MRVAADRAARLALTVALFFATFFVTLRPARADGAFPDAQAILTPPDLPGEIRLVTNFGLLATLDGGATWLWSCESPDNMFGAYYQVGLGPRHRLYALVDQTVVFSDDAGCGWTRAGGLLATVGDGVGATDFWVDRTVAERVLAVDVTCCAGDQRQHVVIASHDGGAHFDETLFRADPGAMITGVESARSAPDTVYVTLQGSPVDGGRPPPFLARTADRGGTWTSTDLTAALGAGIPRLIAVDPTEPRQVFLLWSDVDGQALVVTSDGGPNAHEVLRPSGVIKAFVRLASGTILVATDDNSVAGLLRSRDGGTTFEAVANPPHIRALSERAGAVYAATDNFSDGYAAGLSMDEGRTWEALVSYDAVRGILPCVKAACQASCAVQVQLNLWTAEVCSADVPSSSTPGAGGRAQGGATASGGAGGGGGTGGAGGRPNAADAGGCACSVTAGPSSQGAAASIVAVLALALSTRHSRRGRRGCRAVVELNGIEPSAS
jgi:MYXO-CTERM domain-containing protein